MSSKALTWFLTTSMIVGIPVTIALILVGSERAFHTLTCETARYNCSRSLIHSIDYVVEQVDQDTDVVVTPKKRR